MGTKLKKAVKKASNSLSLHGTINALDKIGDAMSQVTGEQVNGLATEMSAAQIRHRAESKVSLALKEVVQRKQELDAAEEDYQYALESLTNARNFQLDAEKVAANL